MRSKIPGPGSLACYRCGKLNALGDSHCVRCGRVLPVGVLRPWVALRRWLGEDEPFTRAAISVCLLVYVGMYLVAPRNLGVASARFGALIPGLQEDQPWRYLTATFVHYGLLHVGLNSAMLYQLGGSAERAIGSARVAIVLLVSGVGGFLASDAWNALMGSPVPTAGASAGLFGLLGIAAGWRLALGDPEWKRIALSGLGYVVLMVLLEGMLGGRINHAAHFGGLVTGAVLGYFFFRVRTSRRWVRALPRLAWGLSLATLAGFPLCLFLTF